MTIKIYLKICGRPSKFADQNLRWPGSKPLYFGQLTVIYGLTERSNTGRPRSPLAAVAGRTTPGRTTREKSGLKKSGDLGGWFCNLDCAAHRATGGGAPRLAVARAKIDRGQVLLSTNGLNTLTYTKGDAAPLALAEAHARSSDQTEKAARAVDWPTPAPPAPPACAAASH